MINLQIIVIKVSILLQYDPINYWDEHTIMKSYLMALLLGMNCLTSSAIAEQTQALEKSLAVYKVHYAEKWAFLINDLESRTDLSFVQKLSRYEQEVKKLKAEYMQQRISEYNDKEVSVTVQHQCKGRPAGSTKNCGYRCAERPNEDMYTTAAWTTFMGDTTKEIINEEKACFKLEATGNTTRTGSVTAIFRYRTNYVGYITADDADALFESFLPK